jgi:hypothetical protein
MADLNDTVTSGLADYFEKVCAKLHKWVEPLSEEQFWTNPFPYGNDIGHLVLHLTGNLNYYIGARIVETGYIRNRELEFTETARPGKEQTLRDFDRAIDMRRTIGARAILRPGSPRRISSPSCWTAPHTPIITPGKSST